jgi:aspartyl/asparaginyl beta-hydroxylase (cupin superfamily)
MRYYTADKRTTIRGTEKPTPVNSTSITEPEARALADAINQVSANQPPSEALKLVEAALARAPQHPMVLNAAGGHMHRTGNFARAAELFRQAVALDTNSKVLWMNLAGAHRALGDLPAEGAALERALAIDPRYVQALLQRGELMERLGKPKAAALVFGAALASVAPGIPIPPGVASLLTHAQEVVNANSRALEELLEQDLAPLRESLGAEDQRHFDACREVMLGKRRVYASQPKNLLFPFLPAIEFFPREDFPWLDLLESATDEIAAEAVAALHGDANGFSPYVDFPAGMPVDQWAPLNHSMDWSIYSLWHDGTAIADHQARCPRTAAVLAKLPMCDVPGYAPGAYFSVLKPRTRLPPHTGTTNTRSIVHLPLVIPDGCGFRVGAEVRPWKKGQAWVFDDTIEHEAWNDSDQTRIVLIFDIWNPLLTAADRSLARAVTLGIGRHYGADTPTLGSR